MFILCSIGIHNWETICEETYKDGMARKLAITKTDERRRCRKCGKTQELDVHCLGLNPPKYIRTWINVKE